MAFALPGRDQLTKNQIVKTAVRLAALDSRSADWIIVDHMMHGLATLPTVYNWSAWSHSALHSLMMVGASLVSSLAARWI